MARHVLCIAISLHKGSKSPDTKDHVSYCYRLLLFLVIVVHSYPFLLLLPNTDCLQQGEDCQRLHIYDIWKRLIKLFIGYSSLEWFNRARAPDNFQVQRVITPYFWKWWVFAYFLYTVVLSTSEKIAYKYTFKIMFDTSVIQ